MKMLEKELGIVLFDREKRTPVLTATGNAVVERAREILRDYNNIVREVTGEGALHDDLTMGAVPTTMTGLVPRATKSLRDTDAGLHLRIVPGLSADLYLQVDRGTLDAAIVSEPVRLHDQFHWMLIAEEPLIVIAPQDTTEDDPMVILQNYPFIRFNRRAWIAEKIDEWLRAQPFQINEIMELDTLESIATMVYHGIGISIVPRSCVPPPRPLPLKQVAIDSQKLCRRLGLLSRRDSPKSRLVDIVYNAVIREVQ